MFVVFFTFQMHGYGVYTWAKTNPVNDRYQGQMREGKKWGKGTEVWKNGQTYQGGFVDGLMSGFGVLTYEASSDLDSYVGQFQNDEQWGQGTLTWKNGDSYRGEFENGFMHGHGELSWQMVIIHLKTGANPIKIFTP